MFELYDLKDDPHEMTNLAGTPEVKRTIEQDLKGRLAAWMIRHRDFVPLAIGGGQAKKPRERRVRPDGGGGKVTR